MLSGKIIVGLVLVGLALTGGGYASYTNVRDARGPRERRFVIRVCVLGWLLILSMLALVYALPAPYRYITALVYFVVTPVIIYRWSLTHQLLRVLDERERPDAP
ncbi:MAG TPA: hypothetical protein PKE12_07770 [Kiritimatiellia bacterium]|nr:hypothetical protein [Kiritimatiellia bacterium]